MCAIDNLTKGASGGAVQAANVALGLPRPPDSPRSDCTVTAEVASGTEGIATLVEALPYIRRFAGKTVVVKYGGNALAGTSDHDALRCSPRTSCSCASSGCARSWCTGAVPRSPS
jgi:hypothetical protein